MTKIGETLSHETTNPFVSQRGSTIGVFTSSRPRYFITGVLDNTLQIHTHTHTHTHIYS